MEFENILNLRGKNLIGNDLINHRSHNAIIMVRSIEMHKNEIVRDSNLKIEDLYCGVEEKEQKVLKYIYKKYCSTAINYKKLGLVVRDALKLCFKNIDYNIVIETIKQRNDLSTFQEWSLQIIEMNNKDVKRFYYDESLIDDIIFRLKDAFYIECTKW